jgi:hypothetical protein
VVLSNGDSRRAADPSLVRPIQHVPAVPDVVCYTSSRPPQAGLVQDGCYRAQLQRLCDRTERTLHACSFLMPPAVTPLLRLSVKEIRIRSWI